MFVEILPEVWTRARDVQSVWCQGHYAYYRDYNTHYYFAEQCEFSSETAAFHWVKNVVTRFQAIYLAYPSTRNPS